MWQKKWKNKCETEDFDSVEIIVATCKMAAGDRVLQVRFASNLSEQVCESLFKFFLYLNAKQSRIYISWIWKIELFPWNLRLWFTNLRGCEQVLFFNQISAVVSNQAI